MISAYNCLLISSFALINLISYAEIVFIVLPSVQVDKAVNIILLSVICQINFFILTRIKIAFLRTVCDAYIFCGNRRAGINLHRSVHTPEKVVYHHKYFVKLRAVNPGFDISVIVINYFLARLVFEFSVSIFGRTAYKRMSVDIIIFRYVGADSYSEPFKERCVFVGISIRPMRFSSFHYKYGIKIIFALVGIFECRNIGSALPVRIGNGFLGSRNS